MGSPRLPIIGGISLELMGKLATSLLGNLDYSRRIREVD